MDTLIISSSTRPGSLNRALAHQIADRLRADLSVSGEGDVVGPDDVVVADLGDFELPAVSIENHQRDQIPVEAHRFADLLRSAGQIVFVSPEHNGAFPALLKLGIDWATIVQTDILASVPVGLATATPGRGGGYRGTQLTRTWLESMNVEVMPLTLNGANGEVTEADLDAFVTQLDENSAKRAMV